MGWLIAIRRCNYGACWKYADFVRNHLCASTSTAKQTQQHAKTPNAPRRILRRWQIFLAYILIYERKLVQTLMSSIRCSPFRVPLCVSRVPGERLQSIHLRSLDTVAELWPLCCHADVSTTKKKDARVLWQIESAHRIECDAISLPNVSHSCWIHKFTRATSAEWRL